MNFILAATGHVFSIVKIFLLRVSKPGTMVKTFFIIMLLIGSMVFAQDNDDDDDDDDNGRNWMLLIGGGVLYQPLYDGSDKYEYMPVPYFHGEYAISSFKFYASMQEGLGVEFTEKNTDISLDIGIHMGNDRDTGDKDTKKLLKDSPKIKNSVMVFGELGWESPFGTFGVGTEYYRAKADYKSSISKDYTYNGYLYGPQYELDLFFAQNFFIKLSAELMFMNNEYAEAYHSVKYATPKLKQYDADAGLHSIGAELEIYFFFTEHIGIGLVNEAGYLLGDANDSPLTKSPFLFESGLFAAYSF